MEKTTTKIYKADKEWLKETAEREGVPQADVIAKAIEEYADAKHHHECPHCECRFTLDEVDTSTIREQGAINTDVRYLLKGDRTVKDFECPGCEERVTPGDAEIQTPVSASDLSDVDTDEDAEEEA